MQKKKNIIIYIPNSHGLRDKTPSFLVIQSSMNFFFFIYESVVFKELFFLGFSEKIFLHGCDTRICVFGLTLSAYEEAVEMGCLNLIFFFALAHVSKVSNHNQYLE